MPTLQTRDPAKATRLVEAIRLGIREATKLEDAPKVIEDKVLDYLANHFTSTILRNEKCDDVLLKLFDEIRGPYK